MLESTCIAWPDSDWNAWYVHQRRTNRTFRIKTSGFDHDELRSIFWGNPDATSLSMKTQQLLSQLSQSELCTEIAWNPSVPSINIGKAHISDLVVLYDSVIGYRIFQEVKSSLCVSNVGAIEINDLKKGIDPLQTVIVITSRFRPQILKRIQREIPNGIIPVFFHESDFVVGPTVTESCCPCSDCLHIRLGSSTRNYQVFESQISTSENEPCFIKDKLWDYCDQSVVTRLSNMMVFMIQRRYGGGNMSYEYLRLNIGTGRYTISRFLPIHHVGNASVQSGVLTR